MIFLKRENKMNKEDKLLELENRILERNLWRESGKSCVICGYDGPGFYQPETHECAKRAKEIERKNKWS